MLPVEAIPEIIACSPVTQNMPEIAFKDRLSK
jgi:hypothetical protein